MDWLNWSAFEAFVNQRLAAIGILVSIVSFIPIAWTWWEINVGRRRRHSRWYRQAQRTAGERPGILIVDLLEKGNIINDVERYRQSNEHLKAISKDRLFEVSRKKELSPDDMPQITQDLRHVTGEVIEAGVDTLHLFYAGPVASMALVGAEFANVRRVLLYQRNREGMYENWGPLRHHLP